MEKEILKFLENYRHKSDILGLLIFGSFARGENRKNSDIDVFVLVKEGKKRDVIFTKNHTFEFVYSSQKESRKFAKQRPDAYLNMWNDAKIIFDKAGILKKMKKSSEKLKRLGKQSLSAKSIEHSKFDFDDSLKASKEIFKNDPATASMFLEKTFLSILQFYFDKNKIWTPPPKKIISFIKKNDSSFGQEIDKFYIENKFDEKLKIAQNCLLLLF